MSNSVDDFIDALDTMMVGFSHVLRPSLRPHRLTIVQFIVLKWLLTEGPMSMKELAGFLDARPQTATSIAGSLVRNGWAQRGRSPSDRRQYRLSLTRRGREWMGAIEADQRRRCHRALATVAPATLRAAIKGLRSAQVAFSQGGVRPRTLRAAPPHG